MDTIPGDETGPEPLRPAGTDPVDGERSERWEQIRSKGPDPVDRS
jgi:hypothetical protein